MRVPQGGPFAPKAGPLGDTGAWQGGRGVARWHRPHFRQGLDRHHAEPPAEAPQGSPQGGEKQVRAGKTGVGWEVQAEEIHFPREEAKLACTMQGNSTLVHELMPQSPSSSCLPKGIV